MTDLRITAHPADGGIAGSAGAGAVGPGSRASTGAAPPFRSGPDGPPPPSSLRLLVPPTGRNFQTKQALVYHTLREAIMQARLAPGERLVIDDIAKKLEVSAIPVREALQQLMSERLVEHRAHIGAVVTPITPEATREIFILLEALETAAFRLAVERADPATVADLRRLVERMAGSDGERWIEHNRRFHRTFAEIAAMPRLLEALDRTTDDWERLRRYRFLNAGGPDRAGADREHLAMVEALAARDVSRLEQLVRDHNRSALAFYLAC